MVAFLVHSRRSRSSAHLESRCEADSRSVGEGGAFSDDGLITSLVVRFKGIQLSSCS